MWSRATAQKQQTSPAAAAAACWFSQLHILRGEWPVWHFRAVQQQRQISQQHRRVQRCLSWRSTAVFITGGWTRCGVGPLCVCVWGGGGEGAVLCAVLGSGGRGGGGKCGWLWFGGGVAGQMDGGQEVSGSASIPWLCTGTHASRGNAARVQGKGWVSGTLKL